MSNIESLTALADRAEFCARNAAAAAARGIWQVATMAADDSIDASLKLHAEFRALAADDYRSAEIARLAKTADIYSQAAIAAAAAAGAAAHDLYMQRAQPWVIG